MNNTIEFLKGKKTYGVAVIGALYLAGCYLGWFEFDEKVCAGLGVGFAVTLRSALKGISGGVSGEGRGASGGLPLPNVGLDPRVDGYVPTNPLTSQKDTKDAKGGGVASVAMALGLFCALAGEACATGGPMDRLASKVTQPVVTQQTNFVSTVVTNFVPIPVRVDVPGPVTYVTNNVEKLITNVVERITPATNFVVDPNVAGGLKAGQAGAAVAGVFNPGAGAIAASVFGLASLGLGALATWKNKQAREAQGDAAAAQEEAMNLHDQLQATIKGVEQFSQTVDPKSAGDVKKAIAAASIVLGVADDLHATVKAQTS